MCVTSVLHSAWVSIKLLCHVGLIACRNAEILWCIDRRRMISALRLFVSDQQHIWAWECYTLTVNEWYFAYVRCVEISSDVAQSRFIANVSFRPTCRSLKFRGGKLPSDWQHGYRSLLGAWHWINTDRLFTQQELSCSALLTRLCLDFGFAVNGCPRYMSCNLEESQY